jgi:hypothetical protein
MWLWTNAEIVFLSFAPLQILLDVPRTHSDIAFFRLPIIQKVRLA